MMLLKKHDNLKFYCREDTSDIKAFDEVVVNNSYEKVKFWKKHQKDKPIFKIFNIDHWIDLGGNCGAFTCLALSRGATVDCYEPDPFNVRMIEENIKLNKFKDGYKIYQKAVVASDEKKLTMYVGNNNQVWRNSLYKDWGNQKFTVDCIHFSEAIKDTDCVKMDIEGAEMSILEGMKVYPRKLVFEWSFDIDKSLSRYRKVIDRLQEVYDHVYFSNTYNHPSDVWLDSWFPPCEMVWCFND